MHAFNNNNNSDIINNFNISIEWITEMAGGGYFGVKRIGMTVGNPRKLP